MNNLIGKLNMDYWFKVMSIVGGVTIPINLYLGLSLLLFGLGEWTTWESGVTIIDNTYQSKYYSRRKPYNITGILLRVIAICNAVFHFVLKVY